MLQNPIFKGFNPDPAICRKGDDYYVAVSTFEWFPGIRLHESKDMVHWNTLPYPLGAEQLDMRGDPASGGVWAPDLSYADGRFWIVYSDVHIVNGAFKDCANYLVTAEDIRGPWSEPIRVNGVASTPACSMIPMDASIWCSKPGTSVNIIIRSTASP